MADKKEIPFALLEILTRYTDEEHVLTAKDLYKLKFSCILKRKTKTVLPVPTRINFALFSH